MAPSRAKATVPAEAQESFWLPGGHSQTLGLLENSFNRNTKHQNAFKNADCTDDKLIELLEGWQEPLKRA